MRAVAFGFIVTSLAIAGLMGAAGLSTGLLIRSASVAAAHTQLQPLQPTITADACDESVRCVDITKPLR